MMRFYISAAAVLILHMEEKRVAIKYTCLSEKKELEGTLLHVCSDDEVKFSVLQYKSQGNLIYSSDRGMYSEDSDKQKREIENFLMLALKENVELAVAPEAAVPLEIIKKIVDGMIKRPRKGKLWCLGVEGIPLDEYEDNLTEWNNMDDIVVIDSEIGNEKKYVNAAFYLFTTADRKLAIVIQAKTGGMRDIGFTNEQNDLSRGNEIFILDLNGVQEAKNVLAVLVCADVFHVNSVEFCSKFHGKNPLVLHIQMNPKPYYKEIIEFRKALFQDLAIRFSQVVTVNWGRYTSIRFEDKKVDEKDRLAYTDSGSTVYMSLGLNHGYREFREVLKHKEFIKHIGETQSLGFEYFLTPKYEIWKIQEEVQIVNYYVRKSYCNSAMEPIERKFMPYLVNKYIYNENGLIVKNSQVTCDCNEMQEIMDSIGKRAMQDMKTCVGKTCKECIRFYVDTLVSLCLGEEIGDEYLIRDGKSGRAVQTLYQNCRDTKKKLLLRELVEELEKLNFPDRFGEFNENDSFCFTVNRDCAINGGNYKYNLELKTGSRTKRILVIYIGHEDLDHAKMRYLDIRNSLHEDKKDDILLYYSDREGIKVYDEPYKEESILKHNSSFSADIESYIEGN